MVKLFGLNYFRKTNKNGFTLMELIVAMAILAIITGSLLGTYTSSQKKSHDGRRKSDLKQLQNALEAFASDHRGLYPSALTNKVAACPAPADRSVTGLSCDWGTGEFKMTDGSLYMKQMVKDPGSVSYYYAVAADNTSYQVYACLENTQDPDYNEYTSITCAGCPSSNHCNYGLSSSNTTP